MALLPPELQDFHRDLKGWVSYMMRATGTKVEFSIQSSSFSVTLRWQEKSGETTRYTRSFEGLQTERACQVARDIVRAVLEQRGVIT